METLEGFPNLPAMLRCQQSWQAPHALASLMETLEGFPNLPAMLRCQQSWQAPHALASPHHARLGSELVRNAG
jgi:hypothetical protein